MVHVVQGRLSDEVAFDAFTEPPSPERIGVPLKGAFSGLGFRGFGFRGLGFRGFGFRG